MTIEKKRKGQILVLYLSGHAQCGLSGIVQLPAILKRTFHID